MLERDGPGDGTLFELVLRHEPQHNETMRQTLFLAGLLPGGRARAPRDARAAPTSDWIEVPAGTFAMGAPGDGLRLRQRAPAPRASTSRRSRSRARPVTNATWARFSEGGGYERREWWSDEGWAWKEEYDITHPDAVADGRPDAPVCHVSWFEADAFARSHGARLPTEAEWEKAATWDQEPARRGRVRVGVDVARASTAIRASRAHPYREYSEVFFGDGYRVLRGGSWATHQRVATRTFRNWDLPRAAADLRRRATRKGRGR